MDTRVGVCGKLCGKICRKRKRRGGGGDIRGGSYIEKNVEGTGGGN